MARYQVILAYDGTQFEGFQRQKGARTVQVDFEATLHQLGWQGQSILAAGRTDSGVHATGQVVVFDLDWKHTLGDLKRALNSYLPQDMAVKELSEVSENFHPRFDACWRTYQYSIYQDTERNPLWERYAWRVCPAADLQRMRACAGVLPGSHDFAFFGNPPKPGGNTVREVIAASWSEQPDGQICFEVTANAFLYHMVRRLVYGQVMVGQGKIELQDWSDAVQTIRPLPPGLAPPQGLALVAVGYSLNGKRRRE
jgi:tRNA pseudouridine38-40 synthase